MSVSTQQHEKLGSFYLGKHYDIEAQKVEEDLLLYDSKDLVTHGAVLGMTGSGKTGLCLSIIEEAAMDNIPALIIDPKGDIPNLLLTFPGLAPKDFQPWVNEDDARKKGVSVEEYAASQAQLWKEGLADWGQDGQRIQALRDKVDMAIYTPGSRAGLPVSILSSLDYPGFDVVDDPELLSERCESTASSLLSLVGEDDDPMGAPMVLLSNILAQCWSAEQDVALDSLIRHIQVPPFDKIGVMDLESVYPEKERFGLAMKLNNLLASPGFKQWLEGEPLDIQRMLYTPEGKPRISIFSIAHLDDKERMFFVSLLLNQLLGWMRAQSGTSSLRALLYMDEIYGFLPPTANPPSKKPLMTIFKQGRAFGLGALVATQNPVDLDYKALSNIGTWFLGRLQTERDKARVLDGLEGACADSEGGFDRSKIEALLSGLGSRVFLLNNVHEGAPDVFHVRWVMSYLRGPLARRQIKSLMDPFRKKKQSSSLPSNASSPIAAMGRTPSGAQEMGALASEAPVTSKESKSAAQPNLPKGINNFFLPSSAAIPGVELSYVPALLRSATIFYNDSKKGIKGKKPLTLFNPIDLESGEINWNEDQELPNNLRLQGLESRPVGGASFATLPALAFESKTYTVARKEFIDWIYANESLTLMKSPHSGLYSKMGESEGDFRARLVLAGREERDDKIEELRKKFLKKIKIAEDKVDRALDRLDDQKAQASTAKLDTMMRVGGTILGAVLGRRVGRSSRSSLTGASRALKERRDVARAKEKVEDYQRDLEELEEEARQAVEELAHELDPMLEELDTVEISPLKKNISADDIGILWLPYREQSAPVLAGAW